MRPTVDSGVLQAALDDVTEWLGFQYLWDYLNALNRERRAIFKRAKS